jgi:hypothetical protein
MIDNSPTELQSKERTRSHELVSSRTDAQGVLSDSIVRAMMDADGVDPHELEGDVEGGWRDHEPAPTHALVAILADGSLHIALG